MTSTTPNAPAAAIRTRWWQSRTVRIAALIALGATLLSGTGWVALAPPAMSRPAPGSPWDAAGVVHLAVTGGPDVRLTADTHEDLSTPKAEADYVHRLAKIAWRTTAGPVVSVRVEAYPVDHREHRTNSTWTRQQMQERFGPRPAGLDPHGTPPARTTVTLTLPVGLDRAQVAALWSDIASHTAAHLGHDDVAFPVNPAMINACPGPDTWLPILPQMVAVHGPAEATLPGIGSYWTSTGLRVDTQILDAGGYLISATLPDHADLGAITVQASNDLIEAQTVVVMADPGTDCYPTRESTPDSPAPHNSGTR